MATCRNRNEIFHAKKSLFNLWRAPYRSTSCPDCRTYITGATRVFMNVSNDQATYADEPISETVLAATNNGLQAKVSEYEDKMAEFEQIQMGYQVSLYMMEMENVQKGKKLRELQKKVGEQNRKLKTLHIEMQTLRASVKAEVAKNKRLSAELAEKDETIRFTGRKWPERKSGVKHRNESLDGNEMKRIRIENTELTEKLKKLNDCIDMLNMRERIDRAISNRRITRSQTLQNRAM